jgi:hypothetical protein
VSRAETGSGSASSTVTTSRDSTRRSATYRPSTPPVSCPDAGDSQVAGAATQIT